MHQSVSRHSRSLLSGNPVFILDAGYPIKDFGYDNIIKTVDTQIQVKWLMKKRAKR